MRHMRRRCRTASPGQAIPLLALTLVVLCGMLGLAVDVGILAHRNTVLHDAADSAADTGAHVLIFGRNWATPVTDADVWNAMTSTLTMANLTVRNRDSSTPPPDPCNASYGTNQVALSATYLNMSGTPITGVISATSTPPANAWRVKLTLGACQPAAFGGVIGHPRYTVRVDGSAGKPFQGTASTPIPQPYAVSGAPNDTCRGSVTPTPAPSATTPDQVYCPGEYDFNSSSVVIFATGAGLGNDWGSDDSFKGYIGDSAFYENGGTSQYLYQPNTETSGNGDKKPDCTVGDLVQVPIISYVHHAGNDEQFVPVAIIVVQISDCGHNGDGNPTTGTIVGVVADPHGIINNAPTSAIGN